MFPEQTNLCSLREQLLQLGVTPQTAYHLYVRGRLAGWSGDAHDDEHL